MHVPDGFLTPEVALAADALAAVAVGAAVVALRREEPRGGGRATGPGGGAGVLGGLRSRAAAAPVVGAALFAAQMLNAPVGGGTSGHLVGAVLACMLLGAPLGFLTVAVVLAVQALAFADGGLLALGANVLAMGGIGAVAALLAERLVGGGIAGAGTSAAPGRLVGAATAGIAGAIAVLAGAAAIGALIALSGTAPGAVGAMARTHLPIALGEGAITAAVLAAAGAWATIEGWRLRAATVGGLLVAIVALAPHASSSPDGLQRVALELDFAARESAGAAFALAPDYAVPGLTGPVAATIGAALLGIALVALALGVPAALARRGPRAAASGGGTPGGRAGGGGAAPA